jgi:hypothetical protein
MDVAVFTYCTMVFIYIIQMRWSNSNLFHKWSLEFIFSSEKWVNKIMFGGFFVFLIFKILLAHINCTKMFYCDSSIHVYNTLWSNYILILSPLTAFSELHCVIFTHNVVWLYQSLIIWAYINQVHILTCRKWLLELSRQARIKW